MEIAIIGAGIGGLTMGIVLKQLNMPFKIYESAPEIKTVGAGILLGINAMQVYEKLGLREKIAENGHSIREMNIVNSYFKMLSKGDIRSFEKRYGVPAITIHRSVLHKIVSEKIGSDNLILGKKLENISKTSDGYSLNFEDGTIANAHYIIGADGIHSNIRKLVFGKNELRDAEQFCWRGITEFKIPDKFQHKLTESWANGRRFGFTKISGNKIYWYFLINKNLGNSQSNPLDFTEDFPPLVKEILSSTPQENIHFAPIFDLKPIENWSTEKICLIGDAAHATTPNLGQGACQAIEDAYVLGKLLENKSVEKSFLKYPEIRRNKVELIVNTSWKIGKISQWQNPLAVFVRNVLLKLSPESATQIQFAKIFTLEV